MSNSKKMAAEIFGTFWLVFGGCGTAVLAGKYVGLVGISFAFGLTVVTMAYAVGHISGCHLNPAVSLGLAAGGRMDAKELPMYIGSQVIGAVLAAFVLMMIVKGQITPEGAKTAWEGVKEGGFASNGFGEKSPAPVKYGMGAAFIAEVVLTYFFLMVIHGATDKRAPAGFAGLAIGLCLTLIHLIGIPITNLSVNPARSTGPAIFAGGEFLGQLWLFWIAPIVGAVLAGLTYRFLFEASDSEAEA